jgi:hypothetical protein
MDPINQQVGQSGVSSKKTLYIVIGVLVVLLIGGYLYMQGNSAENKMYGAYGVDVDNNLDGSKTIKSDYSVTTSNKLPDNWPSDVPTYKNATISQSTSSDMMGTNGSTVSFTTSDDTQTILDFYKAELTTSGWASLYPGKPITGTQMGAITSLMAKKGDRNFSVIITTNTETGKQVVTVSTVTTPNAKDYKTGL